MNPLPQGNKEHLTIKELARNVCYASKRINVISQLADVYAFPFVALYIACIHNGLHTGIQLSYLVAQIALSTLSNTPS